MQRFFDEDEDNILGPSNNGMRRLAAGINILFPVMSNNSLIVGFVCSIIVNLYWLKIPSCHVRPAWRLKGVWHKIFDLIFFHESVSPGPLSNPLGSFRLFSKIRRDIREWMFISGVNDTGGKFFGGVNDTGD